VESFEALLEASAYAASVLTRSHYARQRVAITLAGGFLFGSFGLIVALLVDELLGDSYGRGAVRIAFLVMAIAWGYGGLLALWLICQVLRCQFDRNIPTFQRVELLSSIVLLLAYLVPLGVSILIFWAIFSGIL
jgi:hypothetical protein